MPLKNEIEQLVIERNIKDKKLVRNLSIILDYYGFGGDRYPLQEEIGQRHGGVSRQYVSNDVIKEKFLDRVQLDELPTLKTIHDRLTEYPYILYSELLALLVDEELIDEVVEIKGLFNLFDDFDLCEHFGVYPLKIEDEKEATKEQLRNDENFFVAQKKNIKSLQQDVQYLLKQPGRLVGICSLNEVFQQKRKILLTFDEAKNVLKGIDRVWGKTINEEFWYLVENEEAITKSNPIITALGKIKKAEDITGNTFEAEILIEVLRNTLDKRTSKLSKPSSVIIEKYLNNSRFILRQGDQYFLKDNLMGGNLTDIEADIIAFSNKNRISTKNKIETYLLGLEGKNHDTSNINKNTYYSPFLYKTEKTTRKEREKFDLIFIAEYSGQDQNSLNRYLELREMLLALYEETDIERQQKQRREQYALRNWLFENKEFENCALCGSSYSISSLIAAHKKPRAICSQNERTDPHIVMPLCNFGCDYVYEKRWVRIENGFVVTDQEVNDLTEKEMQYIVSLHGRTVDARWLEGDAEYFVNK